MNAISKVVTIGLVALVVGCAEESKPNSVDWYKTHDLERNEMIQA